MKRNSMILLIQDMIQERFGFEDAPKFLADELLTLIEKAGMLPPNSTSQIPMEINGTKFSMTRNGNFWEPEHE